MIPIDCVENINPRSSEISSYKLGVLKMGDPQVTMGFNTEMI